MQDLGITLLPKGSTIEHIFRAEITCKALDFISRMLLSKV